MDSENLRRSFEQFFQLKLQQPLGKSGEIQISESTIKYVLTKDASEKTVLDFLILDRNGFSPVHKRINTNGEILELENFQFSLMYESMEEKREEELKMKRINQKIAELIINKGLADNSEEWIQKYL